MFFLVNVELAENWSWFIFFEKRSISGAYNDRRFEFTVARDIDKDWFIALQ